ncbi:MAG: chorismate mutase [Mogibacterium sp.]|nr:chorismate mutase [Mogibacterium sp.]
MELGEIRKRISSIDKEMAELFVKRMEAVKEVAEYKGERGLPVEDYEREMSLITDMSSKIEDEKIRMTYVRFLQNTMELSKQLQYRMLNGLRIACTGEEGTAGHHAATMRFSDENLCSFSSFEKAYRAAETGECDLAVLPMENSYDGEIGQVYDLIFSGSLFVNDVFAVEYNGSTTRYAVLSRIENDFSSKSKKKGEAFLVMFTVKDEIGGLAKAVNIISAYGFNMRVMRSRPMKDLPWSYYIYAELIGDCSRESAKRISRALESSCPTVKIVGHFVENPKDFATSA